MSFIILPLFVLYSMVNNRCAANGERSGDFSLQKEREKGNIDILVENGKNEIVWNK